MTTLLEDLNEAYKQYRQNHPEKIIIYRDESGYEYIIRGLDYVDGAAWVAVDRYDGEHLKLPIGEIAELRRLE